MPPAPSSAGVPQDGHADPEFLSEALEGDAGSESRGGDEVVTARMTDDWKSVVLGADDDLSARGANGGDEGRFQPVGRLRNRKAPAPQVGDDAFGRLEFFISHLGMFVHPQREGLKVGFHYIERLGGLVLTVHDVLHLWQQSTVAPGYVAYHRSV